MATRNRHAARRLAPRRRGGAGEVAAGRLRRVSGPVPAADRRPQSQVDSAHRGSCSTIATTTWSSSARCTWSGKDSVIELLETQGHKVQAALYGRQQLKLATLQPTSAPRPSRSLPCRRRNPDSATTAARHPSACRARCRMRDRPFLLRRRSRRSRTCKLSLKGRTPVGREEADYRGSRAAMQD